MSAPSTEHAKAHAEEAAKAPEAKAAPAGKPAEGGKHGVDGSIGQLLSSIGEAAVRVAQVPGKVHHERAAAAHAAEHAKHQKAAEKAAAAEGATPAEGGDHAKGKHGHDKGSAEKHADLSRVGTEAYNLYKAWDKGEIEDKDVTDLVDSVLDWADIDWARPFVAPLGWGLRKVLGAHEHIHHVITPEYSRLGAQILEWDEDKGGGFHHSYEGLVKGIKDVNALNRAFRHFHDKTIFDAAVKGDRPNLQKRIMALLGEEGDISETEVRSFITTIMHRLGGHGHGVPPHAHIDPHHPLRASLDPKHRALLKLYENAFNWLDKDTLDKIFSDKEPEKNFKIDFEHFGDLLLEEVNPGNRDRYLKSVNARTFEGTFKAKFPYLTNEGALRTALKKDTEREKVLTQLRQFTGVDYSMDLAALTDHVKVLKERVGDKPLVTEPLFAEYEAFERALNLVVTTMTNTGALTDLFEGKTEDTSAKFEWTDEKYRNFGATVLTTVTDKNRAAALKGFDEVAFRATFTTILPAVKVKALNTDPFKKKLREQAVALFRLTEPFDATEVTQQADALRGKMTVSPITPEFAKFKDCIDKAEAALNAAGVIDKLFEETVWTDANNFAANFIEADDYDVPSYVKTYNSMEFRGHFHYLFEMDELDRVIASGTPEEKSEAKEQVHTFAKQNIGNVSQGRMESILKAYEAQRDIAKPILETTASYKALDADINDVKTNFAKAADRLNKLFKPSKEPEVKTVTPDRIGNILKTEIHKDSDVHAFLRGYKAGQVRDYFSILADKEALDEFLSGAGKNDLIELQKLLRAFTGMNIGRVTEKYLETMKKDFQKVFDGTGAEGSAAAVPAELKPKYEHFMGLVDEVLGILKKENLDRIFNTDGVGKMKIEYGQFGAQISNLESDQILPFLRELNISRLGTEYGIFVLSGNFDGLSFENRKSLRDKIAGLFGLPEGASPSQEQLTSRTEELISTLGSNPAIKTDYQAQVNFNQLRTKFGTYLNALNDEVLAKIYAPDSTPPPSEPSEEPSPEPEPDSTPPSESSEEPSPEPAPDSTPPPSEPSEEPSPEPTPDSTPPPPSEPSDETVTDEPPVRKTLLLTTIDLSFDANKMGSKFIQFENNRDFIKTNTVEINAFLSAFARELSSAPLKDLLASIDNYRVRVNVDLLCNLLGLTELTTLGDLKAAVRRLRQKATWYAHPDGLDGVITQDVEIVKSFFEELGRKINKLNEYRFTKVKREGSPVI